MIRIVLAALAALTLAACNPSVKVDPADPWKTLHPWQHNWAEVKKLPSGVEYIIIRKGDSKGGFPSRADSVEVNYDGRFADSGEVFDSSYERKETATFGLSGVIPGWTEGLQKMQPGDMFMFWIPWKEAYGAEGRPGGIPPKADLMFQVELINIMQAAVSDAVAWKKATPWPTGSSDVVRRPSGLEYFPILSGPSDGPMPTEADEVVVHFEGRLESVDAEPGESDEDRRHRTTVLSTFETQEPLPFPVAGLTPGWAEMVKLMHKGDRWMVRMPPSLMYGGEGDGRVPPDSTVIYEVSLENIVPPQEAVAPEAIPSR